MSEMIERVARAMHDSDEASNIVGPFDWNGRDDRIRNLYRRRANAAIAELRKPTQAMLDAFSGMAMPIGYTQEGWEAAIDEALKP